MSSDPVGSLAEEAARLIAAMQGWAHEAKPTTADGSSHDSLAADEHDPLSPECRFCPLCAVARVARSTSPEVREHLSNAALSMALALKGLLDNIGENSHGASPVEKIDLAED